MAVEVGADRLHENQIRLQAPAGRYRSANVVLPDWAQSGKRDRGERMAEEQTQRDDGGGVATARDSLSVTDNRTGETFELEINDGTVKAMDFRQMKVSEDDFGLMTYDPAFTNTASCRSSVCYIDGEAGVLEYRGYPIEQLLREVDLPRGRLPAHLRRAAHPGAARRVDLRDHPPHLRPREHQEASWRASATTPTRWGCCSPPSARCRPSTRTPRRSTTSPSSTWRRSA